MNAPIRRAADTTLIDEILKCVRPLPLSYCDLLADNIRTLLNAERIVRSVGRVQSDLHPEGGYLLSTAKTIDVIDINGTKYRVRVERCDELPRTPDAEIDA